MIWSYSQFPGLEGQMSFNEEFGISSTKTLNDLKQAYFLITARNPRLVTPVDCSESSLFTNPGQLKEFVVNLVPSSLLF